jgi:metallo-beta-lactamase class B
MKLQAIGPLAGLLAAALLNAPASSQPAGTVEAHIAAAKAAAGDHHPNIFNSLCMSPSAGPNPGTAAPPSPDRSVYHVEPVKVFDNLYFVGEKEYSAWAVTTSAGIIILDTIWTYSVEDEIVDGLKKLGLDPAQIKYALVTHGHIDHVGGAKYLQDHFGTRIIMSAADWDLVEQSPRITAKPKRDMIATDGEKLMLGDTTLTLYLTPGHTLGTVSVLIPVKDNGKPHLVAEWGGTGFNFQHSRERFQTGVDAFGRWVGISVLAFCADCGHPRKLLRSSSGAKSRGVSQEPASIPTTLKPARVSGNAASPPTAPRPIIATSVFLRSMAMIAALHREHCVRIG